MATKKVTIAEGDFAGWSAEMHTGISANILLDLESGQMGRVFPALNKLVASHDFKGIDGQPVADLLDAPVEALTALLAAWYKETSLDPH